MSPLRPIFILCIALLTLNSYAQQPASHETQLEISLPTAEQGSKSRRTQMEVVVNIHSDGSVFIEKKPYMLVELQAKMERLVRVNKDQPIRIRGDEDAKYQDIVTVIDRCRKAGIWNISFATQKPKRQK